MGRSVWKGSETAVVLPFGGGHWKRRQKGQGLSDSTTVSHAQKLRFDPFWFMMDGGLAVEVHPFKYGMDN